MAKLTKAQTKQLRNVLAEIERGQAYLMAKDTHVMRECRPDHVTAWHPANTHAVEAGGIYKADAVCEITKEIGSDLCGYDFAIRQLANFIVVNGA